MNIGNNNSANIVNTTHHIGVDAVFGMSYVLGQSSSANSKNSSVNHVGLSVSSLGPLAFNVSSYENQNTHSISNPQRNVKFSSNIGYQFNSNYQSYGPNSQCFTRETRGNRGYNAGYNNKGKGHFVRGRGNKLIIKFVVEWDM